MDRRRMLVGLGLLLAGPAVLLAGTAIRGVSADASGLLLILGLFVVGPLGLGYGYAVLRGFVDVRNRVAVLRHVVLILYVLLFFTGAGAAGALGVPSPLAWAVGGLTPAIVWWALRLWLLRRDRSPSRSP